MRKATKTLLLTAALTVGLSTPAMAADVTVTLPQFPVTLNGTVIDNSYRAYPLLVYRDITYFPMTYYDCRFLGVETEWTQQNGLKINKSNLNGAYHQQNVQQKNKKNDVAQIAAGKITVNGKSINNSKEQFPLLSYRSVTYFPLTWRFAVDEFGWKYNFSGTSGLTIDAGNVKTNSVTLQDARKPESEGDTFGFVIDQKYLYYQGEKGAVYCRPLADLTDDKQRKKIMEIPYEDMYYIGYRAGEFYTENDAVYLRYHQGGATMGQDELYRITDGKQSELLLQGNYDDYIDFGSFKIRIDNPGLGPKPAVPMTYIDNKGQEKALGEKNYNYWTKSDAYDKKRNALYTVATRNGEKAYLYNVDLQDSTTNKISEKITSAYSVAVDDIYYLSYVQPNGINHPTFSQRYLYCIDLNTGQEQYIADIAQTMFQATDNGVYYCDQNNGSLKFWNKHSGKTEAVNGNFKVKQLYRQNDYVVAHFAETPQNPNRLLVLKPSGTTMKQVYASSDCADKAVVNANGLLVYRLEGTNQLVKVQI